MPKTAFQHLTAVLAAAKPDKSVGKGDARLMVCDVSHLRLRAGGPRCVCMRIVDEDYGDGDDEECEGSSV